jgi:hypothetical protein
VQFKPPLEPLYKHCLFLALYHAAGYARGTKVAVKIITHSPSTPPKEVEAAEKEAQLSASLSHPHAVFTHAAYSVK